MDKIEEILNDDKFIVDDKFTAQDYIDDLKKQRDFWYAQYERLLDTIVRMNKTDIKIQNKISK